MPRSSSIALSFVVLTLASGAGGCGSEEENPGEVDQDAAADAVGDTTIAPTDTAADDTASVDTGSADTATTDTATSDTNPTETSTTDTSTADTNTTDGAADASATDTASSDTNDAASADTADVSFDANLPTLPTAEVWVSRVGDGSSALVGGESAAAFVVRYKLPEKTVLGTIALPIAAASANKRLTLSGTATSEGHLLRSVNGAYVTMIGYDVAPGTATLLTAATSRTIARIDKDAVVDTSTTTTSYAGNVVRSAITNDGNQYWLTGDASSNNLGVSYLSAHGGSGAATGISTGHDSLRVINIFGGQLWGTGGQVRIWTLGTGLPTTASTATSVTTATDGSAYGIVGFDLDAAITGIDTLYVCDDRTVASGGGVRRWQKSAGGSFTTVTQLSGGLAAGCRGLSGMVVGTDVVLFVVTGENPSRVGAMVDIGGASTSATFNPIATAATNSHFRGVALKPE